MKKSPTTLSTQELQPILAKLGHANRAAASRYSGDSAARQPVHTVYGGAQLFKAGTAAKLGSLARAAFAANARDPRELAGACGIAPELEEAVFARVREKLEREPVEDFRIDFEDGFGFRPDAEEDEVAIGAAKEVALGMKAGTLPPFLGFRVKSMSEELKARAVRTLDLFVTTLLEASGGALPPHFCVTLPKASLPEQCEAFVQIIDILEKKTGLKKGALRLELMIETTQALFLEDGRAALPLLAKAAGPRLVAAHFGAYDYTAALNVTAAAQRLDHAACDFARHMMKVAFSGLPVWLSDGATNILPVGSREVVHRAWGTSFAHITHSLQNGFYQGWDLHPAQLPVRFAALHAFFLGGLASATERLRTFIDKAAQASLLGDVFDDAASGQGLLNYFLKALNCGAITHADVTATGLSIAEIQTRSFATILNGRKRGNAP